MTKTEIISWIESAVDPYYDATEEERKALAELLYEMDFDGGNSGFRRDWAAAINDLYGRDVIEPSEIYEEDDEDEEFVINDEDGRRTLEAVEGCDDEWWVKDPAGGVWHPHPNVLSLVRESSDPRRAVLKACMDQPHRGDWYA